MMSPRTFVCLAMIYSLGLSQSTYAGAPSNEDAESLCYSCIRNIEEYTDRSQANGLLDQYRQTPKWMRQYAGDALLAAYVCVLITK
jgi:hypothetical protein